MFKIGQREVTAGIFVIATLLALLLGASPDNVYTELLAPLIAVAVTFKVTVDGINARVKDGALTPGSFTALVQNREFIYGVIILVVGLAPMVGINLEDTQMEQYAEIGTNFISVVLGPLLMMSFAQRSSTKPA